MFGLVIKSLVRLMYFGGNGKMRYFFSRNFPSPDSKLLFTSAGIRSNAKKDKAFEKASQWLDSLEADCCMNGDGFPMPSYSTAAVHFLDDRIRKESRVFEFGSGFSSLYFARMCNHVISIEHDSFWFNKIKSLSPDNLNIILKSIESDEYEKSIHSFAGNFDIIIVDGRKRNQCIESCLSKLSSNGVLILDDSHRSRYQQGIAHLREKGFKSLKMFCHASSKMTFTETTFFYKKDNCLGI